MNASLQYPFDLRWTAHDLADAVPLRLSELPDFDAHRDCDGSASANTASPMRSRPSRPYVANSAPPLFRVC